jgi:hypothetical protein
MNLPFLNYQLDLEETSTSNTLTEFLHHTKADLHISYMQILSYRAKIHTYNDMIGVVKVEDFTSISLPINHSLEGLPYESLLIINKGSFKVHVGTNNIALV